MNERIQAYLFKRWAVETCADQERILAVLLAIDLLKLANNEFSNLTLTTERLQRYINLHK